jgi:hypothetical protein
VPQVRDPAVQAILLDVARALSMIVASIRRHCGGEETAGPP